MKNLRFLAMLVAMVLVHAASAQPPPTPWMTNGNTVFGTEWFGAVAGSTAPLEIRHDATDQPIYMHTAGLARLRVNPIEQINFNGYTNQVMTGHVGIGVGMTSTIPPLTYLHIRGGVNVGLTTGYRDWMRVGLLTTDQSDGAYFGLKRLTIGTANSVVNWSDDAGQDILQFIFTAEPDVLTVAGSNDGLEIARMLPDPNGNEGYFGIGDFHTASDQPDERLDVLNGGVKIRDLPTAPYNDDELERIVVVDDDGLLHWRDVNSIVPDDVSGT